jgi:CubicO group peptidase (beta-lactamase class C family)
MSLQEYIGEKLGKPLGWGAWGYCLYRGEVTLPNANGAGSIALHATDVMRFCYCLLRNGRWGDRQIVPAAYMELVGKPSKYNPHCMFSLQFEVNADGHVAGAPKDAYWKSGAGGFCLYVVPSLDLAIYKMGGSDGQYKEELTGIPQDFKVDGSRDGWKPIPRTPFHDGTLGGDDGLRRVLEMVCAAVRD